MPLLPQDVPSIWNSLYLSPLPPLHLLSKLLLSSTPQLKQPPTAAFHGRAGGSFFLTRAPLSISQRVPCSPCISAFVFDFGHLPLGQNPQGQGECSPHLCSPRAFLNIHSFRRWLMGTQSLRATSWGRSPLLEREIQTSCRSSSQKEEAWSEE